MEALSANTTVGNHTLDGFGHHGYAVTNPNIRLVHEYAVTNPNIRLFHGCAVTNPNIRLVHGYAVTNLNIRLVHGEKQKLKIINFILKTSVLICIQHIYRVYG